jgi:hypothetical protein
VAITGRDERLVDLELDDSAAAVAGEGGFVSHVMSVGEAA